MTWKGITQLELQDLMKQWAEYDKKLDASLRLNTRILRESRLDKADFSLSRMSRWIVIELLGCAAVVLVLGAFIGNHWTQPAFLAPAALIQLFEIGLMVSCIRQLATIHSIDYDSPVVVIQRKLGELRLKRIRATKWTLLLAPLLWVPLLIVIPKGLLGVSAYTILDPAWLIANLVFGLAFIPLMLWLAKNFAHLWRGSAVVRTWADDIAGRNLTAAEGFLEELSRFEEGET